MKIRNDVIKISKSMHTWVGVSSGILLFICFFAGGLSIFQNEISRWATPPQQVLPAIANAQYPVLIQKLQQDYPATQQAFTLNLNALELHQAPIHWTEKVDADHFNAAQQTWLASLNAQGELIVRQENLAKAGWLVEQLHETAGIPGMVGHHALGVYIMGAVALLYFLALMSGLIILMPTLAKDFFAMRQGKNKKRFWLDTHNVVGITSLPFHIVISISVVVFAFHDLFYDAISTVALDGKSPFGTPVKQQVVIQNPQLDVQQILAQVQQHAPEYEIQSIQFSHLDQPAKAKARVGLYSPALMLRGAHHDFMVFNPYQLAQMDDSNLASQRSASADVVTSMFSLHFGNFGGNNIRWIYFILGLGGAYLFYSGNMLWIETRARKQKQAQEGVLKQRRDVVFLANLTIATCLGCVLAIASALMAGKISTFMLSIDSMNHLYMTAYYAVFIASVVYTVVVGYQKALVHLLLAIACVLMMIPFSTIVAVFSQGQIFWFYSDLWCVDLTACILALLFFRFYQMARRRAKTSEIGSLWSDRTLEHSH